MTDKQKLDEITTRVSDLGSILPDVARAKQECPLAETLYLRLWAIRELVIGK